VRDLSSLRNRMNDDVLGAARALLGAHLVRGNARARIVEVEAYRNSDDPGSHAFRGRTPRNAAMFGPPGTAYVYFTYGMHWMLNVAAQPEGQAAAVLVRAAQPLAGLDEMRVRRAKARSDRDLLSGPAKLAAAFGIARPENGIDLLSPDSDLRLEPGEPVANVLVGTRIGIPAGKGDLLPWRFCDADALAWVSKPLP
jgi:DNA-3-methyladenine glycosylase